jgi:hypothetical protein
MKSPRLYLLLPLLGLLFAAESAPAQDDSAACAMETSRQEKLQAIPDRLLHAISLVESGRWDGERKANLAWPWTVMAEGEGRFLPSKQAAIAEVRKLRAKGVRNIDVGCMQINLLAHPDAFATLDEAFDPGSNVAYAAHFLSELHDQTGSWPQAGAFYHSQTPELAAPYKAKLMAAWTAAGGQRGPLQLAALDGADAPRLPLGVSFPIVPPRHDAAEAAAKADPPGRGEQERLAAKHAADAYRQAKLAEYRQKHGMS